MELTKTLLIGGRMDPYNDVPLDLEAVRAFIHLLDRVTRDAQDRDLRISTVYVRGHHT